MAAQLALIGLLVVLPHRRDRRLHDRPTVVGGVGAAAGVLVMAAGAMTLGRGLTAVPLPNQHAQMRTEGLYRVVRHPIYTGLLLTAGCPVVVSRSAPRLVTFAALVALLTGKARWEEARLVRRFPAYRAYAARTPRFVPGWRRGRD